MFCPHCAANIDPGSKFCSNCGQGFSVTSHTVYPTGSSTCDVCGVYAPVKYVEFYENVGMLVARHQRSVRGNLCKNCINQYFKKFTLTTLFFGWWGIISFFAAAVFLINNVFRYLTTLSLEYPRR
jgi:hypothetical protein